MYSLTTAISSFTGHCTIEKNLSEKTIKAYKTDLAQLLQFLIGKGHSLHVPDITKTDLRAFLESLSELKPKSVKRKIATIKAMFNYLEFDDAVQVNPFRKMRIKIREQKKLPKVMTLPEIRSIFKAAYDERISIYDTQGYKYFERLRNIIVLELLFATGGRVSEIANLKDDQIDLRSGTIIIKGKGNKERLIQVCNKETITVLRQYRALVLQRIRSAGNYFLINRFNNKLSDQSIRSIVKNICKEAGMRDGITPHVFRHSFATLLLEKDVDIKYIQSMLGHSSIMTTQIYTHVNKEKQKQILKAKHPRKDFSIGHF